MALVSLCSGALTFGLVHFRLPRAEALTSCFSRLNVASTGYRHLRGGRVFLLPPPARRLPIPLLFDPRGIDDAKRSPWGRAGDGWGGSAFQRRLWKLLRITLLPRGFGGAPEGAHLVRTRRSHGFPCIPDVVVVGSLRQRNCAWVACFALGVRLALTRRPRVSPTRGLPRVKAGNCHRGGHLPP